MDEKRICPQCGEEIGETDKFCAYCGLNLSEIELKETESNEKFSESDQDSVNVEAVDVKEDEDIAKVGDNMVVEVDENETTDSLEKTTMSPPPVSHKASETDELSNDEMQGVINAINGAYEQRAALEKDDEEASRNIDKEKDSNDEFSAGSSTGSSADSSADTCVNSSFDSNWIYCSVCGKKLSKDAHTCPYCGHPIKNVQTNYNSNGGGLSFWGVVMAIVVAAFIIWLG